MRSTLLRFFPPPAYLANHAAGVDISDRSIKYIMLAYVNGVPCLKSYGEQPLTPGIVERGKVRDIAALGEELKKIRATLPVSAVVLALPEEHAYAFLLSIPPMARRDLRASIELQLENQIPVPAQSVIFDYDIIQERADGAYEVEVAAIAREDVSEYINACTHAGLMPQALEIEAHSVARALLPASPRSAAADEGESRTDIETALIVDMGRTRTGLTVVTAGFVAFTSTVQGIGGGDITTVVQKNLRISRDIAEQYKIERGLSRAKENRDLFYALIPIASVLKDEILKRCEYWNIHERKERGATGGPVSRIILTGGQSTLPGLDEYLAEHAGIPVELAAPWRNVPRFKGGVPPIPFNESLGYTTAIGLALRGLHL